MECQCAEIAFGFLSVKAEDYGQQGQSSAVGKYFGPYWHTSRLNGAVRASLRVYFQQHLRMDVAADLEQA
jgi:hypothetical protein